MFDYYIYTNDNVFHYNNVLRNLRNCVFVDPNIIVHAYP